ncbi:MAG: hypothetical protein O7F70_04750 [Gemmatimonadetes bacterium]|nr:hypothetical protein [Gemmatimonadota bacterium]
MSGGKGPDRENRQDSAIVDNLLEDLFFSEPGSKVKSGESRAIPKKQPRPSGSAPGPISQKRPSVSGASVARRGGNARGSTWGRISVAALIAIGMLQWPYDHACGLELGYYLAAVAMVLVSALWASTFSWKNRKPLAHVVSQGLLIWGLVLAAGEVLPRVGYAKDLATWRCVAAPVLVPTAIVPSMSSEADEGAIPAEETPPTVPDARG